LGLLYVRGIGPGAAGAVVENRERDGAFQSLADLMERTGVLREALESLAEAGALDGFGEDRRALRWEIGLRYRPVSTQLPLGLPVEQGLAYLPPATEEQQMEGEYHALGLYPSGHIMAHLRPSLPGVLTSQDIGSLEEGQQVTVAGLVIRRQRPMAKTVFISLEDEFGHIPLVVWQADYARLKHRLGASLILVQGTVSRKEGTLNIVVKQARPLAAPGTLPKSKDWG
ncbi:MAG: OB-fold nucleic acid binding domain-containing protein, partial [Dehalococcoidia bacterium]